MKRFNLTILAVIALLLIGGLLAPTGRAKTSTKESIVVEFPQKVKLLNVVLRGEYVFVHDEEKMARGEACTYIYTSVAGQPGNLVVSFHCQPAERQKADRFTIVTKRVLPDLLELQEYQFAGSTEAHQVPKL
jgi:hypothetical protein